MLDQAAKEGTARPVEWRQADAQHLQFPDASFDMVVCQFGVMFFPDKAQAYAEARRVQRPGGQFLFNVWDRIEENEFADTAGRALATLFPDDPPQFMARVPHGYHNLEIIAADLRQGGFTREPQITTVSARSRAESVRIPAVALCRGTPLGGEIVLRDPERLGEATDRVEAAIAATYGDGPVDGKIQAHIVTVEV